MKELIFVRHAKSSWVEEGITDLQRPLNSRGNKDAPVMAEKLRLLVPRIDLFISSPSLRTRSTAEYFMKCYGVDPENLTIDENIYDAYSDDLLAVIRGIESQITTVIVFGHNPGVTIMANIMSEDFIDNVPTCGIFKVTSDVSMWRHFDPEKVRFDFLKVPQ